MNSKDLTVAAPSSATTNSATERYTIMRGSTRRQDDKFLAVARATEACARLLGWEYRVHAGHGPAYEANLRWLSAFRASRPWYPDTKQRLGQLLTDGARSVNDVFAADDGTGELISGLWHHVWAGHVAADLESPLCGTTALRWAE